MLTTRQIMFRDAWREAETRESVRESVLETVRAAEATASVSSAWWNEAVLASVKAENERRKKRRGKRPAARAKPPSVRKQIRAAEGRRQTAESEKQRLAEERAAQIRERTHVRAAMDAIREAERESEAYWKARRAKREREAPYLPYPTRPQDRDAEPAPRHLVLFGAAIPLDDNYRAIIETRIPPFAAPIWCRIAKTSRSWWRRVVYPGTDIAQWVAGSGEPQHELYEVRTPPFAAMNPRHVVCGEVWSRKKFLSVKCPTIFLPVEISIDPYEGHGHDVPPPGYPASRSAGQSLRNMSWQQFEGASHEHRLAAHVKTQAWIERKQAWQATHDRQAHVGARQFVRRWRQQRAEREVRERFGT